MSLKITRHAFKRARQRLGLNRKAFIRAIKNNNVHKDYYLVIVDNVIVTVKSVMNDGDRKCKSKLSKAKRADLLRYNQE